MHTSILTCAVETGAGMVSQMVNLAASRSLYHSCCVLDFTPSIHLFLRDIRLADIARRGQARDS